MRRRLQLAMVVLSLTAFVGGCGGGDDKEKASPTTVATTPPTTTAPGLAAVFKPIAGYQFVELPDSVLQEMEADLTSDPQFSEVIEDFQAQSVTKNGEGVGIVMVMKLDDKYAALPGVEQGIIDEFSSTAASTRKVSTAGDDVTVATDADGTTYVVWVNGSLVVMVIGQDEGALLPVATSLITSNK